MIEIVCSKCGVVGATLVSRIICDGCGKPAEHSNVTTVNVRPADAMWNERQFQYHPECAPKLAAEK
jgi:hypothetical protein